MSSQEYRPPQESDFQMFVESRGELLPDPGAEAERIVAAIEQVSQRLGKKKAAIAISGGLDSTVLLDLTRKSLGNDGVLPIYMPNEFTESKTGECIEAIKNKYGIPIREINIDGILYQFPEYEESAKFAREKLDENYKLETENDPKSNWVKYLDGSYDKYSQNMTYLFASATLRAALLRTQALCNSAMVLVAPNKTEKLTGLYTEGGPDCDGDFQPLVHLNKAQVFQLGEHLQIPQEIIERVPTGDLKTLSDEKSLGCPYQLADLILIAYIEYKLDPEQISNSLSSQFAIHKEQLEMLGYTNPSQVVQNIIDVYNLSRNKSGSPLSLENHN